MMSRLFPAQKEAPSLLPTIAAAPVRNSAEGHSVLSAPGGALNYLDPHIAEICALVRRDGKLCFYVLAGQQGSAELSAFVEAAALQLNEAIPAPVIVDQRALRAINVDQAEARIGGAKGTESRARLNTLIARAAAAQSSDVKLDRTQHRAMVRLQRNGYLSDPLERFDMTAEDADLLITSAFNYADAGDSVEQPASDQKFTITDPAKLPANVQTVRCQTAALEGGGRRLDMRFIYKATEFSAFSLADIGLLPEQLDSLYFVQQVSAGLFTITAPTDNGKSTTLNLFSIDMVRAQQGRIDVIGVDDPVEFMAPEICQLAMGERIDGGDPFAQKLLTTLRLAPHAIKIGECRTVETANAAIDAAITGRLVMTTQHSTGALGVPYRYERMGVDRHVAFDPDTHVCWMSQRLLSSLCLACRIPLNDLPGNFDRRRRAVVRRFNPVTERHAGSYFLRGPGCGKCRADGIGGMPGLSRRILAAEVILPDTETCRLLAGQREAEARRRCIVEFGVRTMAQHAFRHLREGVLGLEEFLLAASPRQLLDDLDAEQEAARCGAIRHRELSAAE